MKKKKQIFVDKLISAEVNKILSIKIMGSCKGEIDLAISDIDFLIICKNRKDISSVFETALRIQEKIFGIKTSKINRFIQKFFLASNSYNGIHLIVLSKDEFDENFHPTSLRLRFITKLIGRNLFLHEVQQNHHLLYGKNLVEGINVEQSGFSDKLSCFLFPCVVLMFLLPTLLFSRRTFKIWCFKIIKYHNVSLRSFIKITKQNYVIDDIFFKTVEKFRYKPEEYKGNSAILYIRVWKNLLRNLPFLFKFEINM